MRIAVLLSLGAGSAAATLFATLPWVGTRSLAWRLAPHVGTPRRSFGSDPGTDHTGSEALRAIGASLAVVAGRVTGVVEPLPTRLDRVRHHDDPAAFRFRQGSIAVSVAVIGAAMSLSTAAPPLVTLVLVAGLPLATVLTAEIGLTLRCRRWSTETRLELPVIGEQLVALLQAGRSPTAALEHVADHQGTPLRRDLARVIDHLHHGGGLDEALVRWAEVSDVDAVHRLAAVLALHHRTPDLADLVSREVDASRDDLHRELLAQIDKRGQQVWIPVTVAALIPGAIFLLVPFFDALRLFGATS